MPSIVAFFLVGPTAVGKSAVAQWIAEKEDYDILSADSMLVYRDMDIGTAKPSADDRSRVRYHGIDLIAPDEAFSVWAYRRYACGVLAESALNSRKTIIVGGTGLYIKSLTDGLASIPASDPALHAYWTQVLEERGIEALQKALWEKSAVLYESLRDKRNGRRLIRALELAEAGIEKPPLTWGQGLEFRVSARGGPAFPPGADQPLAGGGPSSHGRRAALRAGEFRIPNSQGAPPVGLMLPTDQLKSRIELRVAEMYRAGFVEEVGGLLERYAELSPTARQAIGYAEVIDFLNGRCSLEVAQARTVMRTRQFAKRQKTWFKHQANVGWIDIDIKMKTCEIAEQVLEHWRKYGPTEIVTRSSKQRVAGSETNRVKSSGENY